MKRASVYVLETKYLIHSQSTTDTGYGIASEPFIVMDRDVDMKEVASKVVYAMNQSKTNVKDFADAALETILDVAGLKNHKDLYKKSIHCMVYEKDSKMFFLPSVNKRVKGEFAYMAKKKIEVNAGATMDEVEVALKNTLKLCE